MLTDEDRIIRDPTVLQQYVLELEKEITAQTVAVNDAQELSMRAHMAYLEADSRLRQEKNKLRGLRDRMGSVQSVLKSLPRE